MSRLFVGIWLPDDVLERFDDLERPRDPGVRWMPRENLHITLRFLGDADEADVIEALDGHPLPAATAVLGPALDLPDERTVIVPVAGVDELAAVVHEATRGLGSQSERRRFLGHVTVARLARRARPTRAAGQRFTARFGVEEVALVASTLTPDGSRYETVATWRAR